MTEEKKEKKAAYYKEWYAKNRDSVLAKQRERGKRNYQEGKEKYKERSRQWRLENPERYRELTKKYSEKNKELVKARSAEWYAKNRERAALTSRKNKLARYGLTLEEYENLLLAQGGGCAICGTKEGVKYKDRLHVDHCHSTGAVRGLLCHHCNVGLGSFKDRAELLKKAAEYLTKL